MKELNRGKIIKVDGDKITVKFYDCTETTFLKNNILNEINLERDVVLYNNGSLKSVPVRIRKSKFTLTLLLFVLSCLLLITSFFSENGGLFINLIITIGLGIMFYKEYKLRKNSIDGVIYLDKFDPSLKNKKIINKNMQSVIKALTILIVYVFVLFIICIIFYLWGCSKS